MALVDDFRDAVRERLEQQAPRLLERLRVDWPAISLEHPYATNESYRDLRVEVEGNALVVYGPDYAEHVNVGATRWYGPRSARPWIRAGARPYTAEAMAETREVLEAELRDVLTDALHSLSRGETRG